MPVEGVVGQAGGGHDVGDPGPGRCPARPHDVERGVEEAPHLARVVGAPSGQRPLRDACRDARLRNSVSRNRVSGTALPELSSAYPESLFCPTEGGAMAWDFETEPEFQAKLDWADEFVREEVEPLDLIWPGLEFTPLDETRRKVDRAAEGRGAPPEAVGHPPRPRARRRGLRPAQAVAAERDPGPLVVGPDRVRLPGARHRQRRDHRPLRHARAEGALPAAAARGRDLLLLLDDRAPRRRPTPRCSRPGPSRTATSG